MRAAETTDYETILQIVRNWPPARRISLMQDMLRTLVPTEAGERAYHPTLKRALGLLATDQPAPSDEEVALWLGERRVERYGQ